MNLQSEKKSRFDLVKSFPERGLFFALAVFVLCTIGYLSRVPAASAAAADTPGDAMRGQQVFEKRCTGCHSLDKEKEGPRLRGVFGRKAGAVPSFSYSSALKSANITWTAESLNQWLADTDRFIPDNDMNMSFRNPNERADIIAYLRQLSNQ